MPGHHSNCMTELLIEVSLQGASVLGKCQACYLKVRVTNLQDPIGVCRSLFGRLVGRERCGFAAEVAGLTDPQVSIARAMH